MTTSPPTVPKAEKTGWLLVAGLFVLAAGSLFAMDSPSVWRYVFVVAVAGGFGGFVQGTLRRTPTSYTLVMPFSNVKTELGFLGDVLIGVAAGTSIFVVMESFFGLGVEDLKEDQGYLRLIALGVISGYMGSNLLESLSMLFSKRMVKAEEDFLKAQEELERLRKQAKAASRTTDLMSLADAYMRWNLHQEALQRLDEAIAGDPNNADLYIRKSFVYAHNAQNLLNEASAADKLTKDLKTEAALGEYDRAIVEVNNAIRVDDSSARAYYDRACYRQMRDPSKRNEVLSDLEASINKNASMRELAKHDPDFEGLRNDAEFRRLVPTDHDGTSQEKTERSVEPRRRKTRQHGVSHR